MLGMPCGEDALRPSRLRYSQLPTSGPFLYNAVASEKALGTRVVVVLLAWRGLDGNANVWCG
jgi:hypothetical protein